MKYNFLDVGSRYSLASCLPNNLNTKAFKDQFNFYGIEPDEVEWKRLKTNATIFKDVYNVGLYNTEGTYPLHLTKGRGKSSMYPPDLEVIKKHLKGDLSQYNTDKVVDISVTTIDILFKDLDFDIIKIDVQGVEYEILEGAINHLDYCSSVWVETSTVAQYKNQKTHEEIVEFLDGFGFKAIKSKVHSTIPCEQDVYFVKQNDTEITKKLKNWLK